MLANGITLSYGEAKGTYTKLVGLKEVPEFGIELEKVENTTLEDTVKTVLRSILKAKYLLSLAVAVSMPLSSSHLRLPCSQSWNLQTVLEVN